MNCSARKLLSLLNFTVVLVFISGLGCLPQVQAQYFNFTQAIPTKDANGVTLAGANTTFADGSAFQPVGDLSRSSSWAWRPFGNNGILSSLGPSSSTAPTNTKELVTTVAGLKAGKAYAIKALFWADSPSPWGVRAGLTYAHETHTNTWFDPNSTNVVPANFVLWGVMPTNLSESGRTLYAADLGTATSDGNGRLKVFIHDFPTGDSTLRTWYQGVAVSEVIPLTPQVIDASATGTSFHRGVRGIALTDVTIDRGEYWSGIPKSLEVVNGSAIRGVSTGISAELYDWRTRNGQPRPPTLQFLRYSRDYNSELFMGINMRGLVQPNPAGGFLYYDTQASTLAALAADWVHYVNYIVPTYRQGDTITNSRDAAIMNSLTWSSSVPGDSFDTLLAPSETSVPQVKYWEIGNEPTVGTTAYSVSNSFTLNATNYYARYKAIVQAMKAENPSVKVGPTIIDGTREASQLNAVAADLTLPIDFISYHPYEKLDLLTDPAQMTQFMDSIWSRQKNFLDGIKAVLTANGRDPSAVEYAATEVNVSDWPSNDTTNEARMAHALGTAETIFTHARLGLVSSLYWVWPAHRYDGTEYPEFKAYQGLRDHMGDTLISTYIYQNIRMYTTRDSRTGEIAVWVLNFSNDQDTTIQLQLQNLSRVQSATLLRLQDTTAKTTLNSSNLATDMPGGPTMNVNWTSIDLTATNLSNYSLTTPAATISVLVVQPGLGSLTPSFVNQAGQKHFTVTFRQLPNASNMHYNLLASDDLVTWEVVGGADAGASDNVAIQDTRTADSSTRRFYRIESVVNGAEQ